MQIETFPIILNSYRCKEVLVNENNSYSKLVSNTGFVAVLVSEGYGCDWSVSISNPELKKQMILDSRLIQYISSEEFNKHYAKKQFFNDNTDVEEFKELLVSLIPEIGGDIELFQYRIREFAQLTIKFVPVGCAFRIEEYDGNEYITLYDPNDYISV